MNETMSKLHDLIGTTADQIVEASDFGVDYKTASVLLFLDVLAREPEFALEYCGWLKAGKPGYCGEEYVPDFQI